MIHVDVIYSEDAMVSLATSLDMKVVDLKEDLAEIYTTPANEFSLTYNGITLEDDKTLDYYGIKELDTLHMEVPDNRRFAETETTRPSDTTTYPTTGIKEYHTIHMELSHKTRFAVTETTPPSDTTTGGLGLPMEEMIMIDIICSNGDMFSVTLSVGSKVVDFKELLAQITCSPANEQRLIYRGTLLEDDDRTLDSYGLQEYHTIHMYDRLPTGCMLLYPAISQMMQTLFSSPQIMKQIIDQNPQLHSMFDSIPRLREMMQNTQVVRRLTSPKLIQKMMSSKLPPELNQQSPLGGIVQPRATAVPLEQLYTTQLSQLQETSDENIEALRASGGNVDAVLMRGIGYFGP